MTYLLDDKLFNLALFFPPSWVSLRQSSPQPNLLMVDIIIQLAP